MMERHLGTPEHTDALGNALAAALAGDGAVITLHGELGAGKTSLVRAVLRGLGHEGRVPSPTYTLLESYEPAGRSVRHLDLYRLADPDELEFLGFRDLIEPDHVIFIEWPERGGDLVPGPDLAIRLEYEGRGRHITIDSPTERGRRIVTRLSEALSGS